MRFEEVHRSSWVEQTSTWVTEMHVGRSLLISLDHLRNSTSEHMLWLVNHTSHGSAASRSEVEEKFYPVVCIMFVCGALLFAVRACAVFRRTRALVARHTKLD